MCINTENTSFLVLLPHVLLAMFNLFRVLKSANRSGERISWRRVKNMIVRVVVYSFAFSWAVVVHIKKSSNMNMMPAFIPILVYAVYSFIESLFFLGKEKSLGHVYQIFYKFCRVIVYIQLVAVSDELVFLSGDSHNQIDLEDLNKKLWPIHIGALLVLPAILILLAYYVYSLFEMMEDTAAKICLHLSSL